MTAEARNPQGVSGATKTCVCLRDDAWDCIEARYPCTCHWEGGSEHEVRCGNNRDLNDPCACRCHDEHRADVEDFDDE